MTPALSILTRKNDALAKHVVDQLTRRKFRGHGEIQLVLSDRKDERREQRKQA